MDKVELERRTKAFALRVISLVAAFRRDRVGDVLARQLLRSATSIGANYREANRAESRLDFIHKIAIVEKESAETLYWLELCDDAKLGDRDVLIPLRHEARELLAVFTRIGKTTKANSRGNSKFEIRNSKS